LRNFRNERENLKFTRKGYFIKLFTCPPLPYSFIKKLETVL